jgi:serine/arginine repetitive matrix protein 2
MQAVDLGAPEGGLGPSTLHEAGHRKANTSVVQQETSPPLSPLSETEGTITRSPPPSARPLAKVDFPLLSPPHGLPDLPEPPSFSGEDDKFQTPVTVNGCAHPDLITKTPRPPGAWQDTPAPRRLSVHSVPDNSETEVHESGLVTPASSFSRARATSMPMQTPAFPGAWMATPGTDRRKSLLKVRFDVESEPSLSEGMSSEPNLVPLSDRREDSGIVSEQIQQRGSKDFNPFVDGETQLDGKQGSPPELSGRRAPMSSRSPRRPATVRVVDAFGREEEPDNRQNADDVSISSNTSRNKSMVRIVDALGRELNNVPNAENEESILSHNEALWRIRQGIAELTEGWSDIDMYDDDFF